METSFTTQQLADPEIKEAATLLKDCVHYGFCTAVCPTWVLSRDENDGPRGRIDLIRDMLERGGVPAAKTVKHIDTCLSCNSCMTTCAAKVDYMHLADRARIHIERHYARPTADRLLRALIATILPRPPLFKLALGAAALVNPFRRILPGRLRGLIAMARSARAPVEGGLHPARYPAEGEVRLRVALLDGCAQQVLAPHITAATIRLLARHGCEVTLVKGAVCCGALTLHMGKEAAAKKSARQTITAWWELKSQGKLDAIVVNASGCGTTIKDYGHLFQFEPEIRDRAREISTITYDVTEMMDRLGLRAISAPTGQQVAYHDACSLQHAQKITTQPRGLLRRAGYQVFDVPERHFCCGSAGTYNMLQPEIAAQLGERKARNIESTGASIVAAGNLGCITQLATFTNLPIIHTVELLDWATGGPRPVWFEELGARDRVSGENSMSVESELKGIW